MSKINFKDYSDNYKDIKKKEKELKRQEKLEDKKILYELNAETEQECLELKEFLEILKSIANSNYIDKEEIKKFTFDKLKNIHNLKKELISKNDNIHIFFGYKDNVKNIIIKFIIATITAVLLPFFGMLIFSNSFPISLLCALIFYVVFDEITHYFDSYYNRPCIRRGLKTLIGMLPFNNRYSFVKVIKELEKIEQEYQNFDNQYKEYLKYLENVEETEVVENTIKPKEGKDILLLINELRYKIPEIHSFEKREKYLTVLSKLEELYKRERERILRTRCTYRESEENEARLQELENRKRKENEARLQELKKYILKELIYIEMQIDSSIYKNKNVNLISEDYLTTLGKLDNAKGKKLERTLGLGK